MLSPKQGPRILFFSGGTALRGLSRELIAHTHNSVHVITPFDSGGSSAVIRQAFAMPAPGDMRNRLMALADRTHSGNPEVFELFATRLPKHGDEYDLDMDLAEMAMGRHPLVAVIPEPMRSIICEHITEFMECMPEDFNLHGASIGNIILTAGYLKGGGTFPPVLRTFGKLAKVKGMVLPVAEVDLHIAAELENGETVCGQHRLTGKAHAPLTSPIKRMWMAQGIDDPTPTSCEANPAVLNAIAQADLICLPMGSFYSSIMANLLPDGICEAISKSPRPKVYIPNLGQDPEAIGLSTTELAKRLAATIPLSHILVDSEHGVYPGGLDVPTLSELGLNVCDAPLVTDSSQPYIDPVLLAKTLIHCARS